MKNILSLLALSPLLLGATLPPGRVPDETELAEHMESIEEGVKLLRRSLRDEAQRAESLAQIASLESETLICKGLIPEMAESLPEAERPAFVTAYQRMLVDFLTAQLELEAALLDGDADAAQAAFGKVRDFEDRGHERFTRDEDE